MTSSGRAPAASIVVLDHDGHDHLATCLESLRDDGWPSPDVELLVVDNGSRTTAEALLRPSFPGATWLATGRNLGFAGGIRFGVERARGETLVFLNNDTRVERGWLSALLSSLDGAPPEVAAVTGKLTSWDGARIDYRDTLLAFDGHAFQKEFGFRFDEAAPDDPPGSPRVAPCGGNMAIRRSAWTGHGGFDDAFFAYLEDVDLGLRLASRGLSTIWEPRAVVRHHSGATGEALGIYNRGFLIEKNAFSVVWANFDDETRRALLPAVFLTLVHRVERIMRERAPDGALLTVDPYRGTAAGRKPAGLRRTLLRYVARVLGLADDGPAFDLADPHSLANLRALHRISVELPRLEAKRRENERLRRVSSRELFDRFPLHVVPTYPGDEELFSSEAFLGLLPGRPALRRLSLREVQR